MTAADSTSKAQFGWVEDTEVRKYPVRNEFESRLTAGTTSLSRVALDEAEGDDVAPQEVRIAASWSEHSPSLYTPEQIERGINVEDSGQHELFYPGRRDQPVVSFMESTKRSRFAAMGGLGTMVNLLAEHTGQTPAPDHSLSPHSAPLVERLTGTEQKVSNQMDFVDPSSRDWVDLPRKDVINKPSSESWGGRQEVSTTHRMVPDAEIAAGKATLVSHMREMRGPKPDRNQSALFADPGGPSLGQHQDTLDMTSRIEARDRRSARGKET